MNFIVNKYQGNVKLLLIACDEDEQKFLESHIGEVVELHAAQQPRALDGFCTCDPAPEETDQGIGNFVCVSCGKPRR